MIFKRAAVSWMRTVAVEDMPGWEMPTKEKPKRKEKQPLQRKPSRTTNKKRSRRRASGIGWYRSSFAQLEDDLVEENTDTPDVLVRLDKLMTVL